VVGAEVVGADVVGTGVGPGVVGADVVGEGVVGAGVGPGVVGTGVVGAGVGATAGHHRNRVAGCGNQTSQSMKHMHNLPHDVLNGVVACVGADLK